jgi:hypothetical protein
VGVSAASTTSSVSSYASSSTSFPSQSSSINVPRSLPQFGSLDQFVVHVFDEGLNAFARAMDVMSAEMASNGYCKPGISFGVLLLFFFFFFFFF